jgi:hypothetical protein
MSNNLQRHSSSAACQLTWAASSYIKAPTIGVTMSRNSAQSSWHLLEATIVATDGMDTHYRFGSARDSSYRSDDSMFGVVKLRSTTSANSRWPEDWMALGRAWRHPQTRRLRRTCRPAPPEGADAGVRRARAATGKGR